MHMKSPTAITKFALAAAGGTRVASDRRSWNLRQPAMVTMTANNAAQISRPESERRVFVSLFLATPSIATQIERDRSYYRVVSA